MPSTSTTTSTSAAAAASSVVRSAFRRVSGKYLAPESKKTRKGKGATSASSDKENVPVATPRFTFSGLVKRVGKAGIATSTKGNKSVGIKTSNPAPVIPTPRPLRDAVSNRGPSKPKANVAAPPSGLVRTTVLGKLDGHRRPPVPRQDRTHAASQPRTRIPEPVIKVSAIAITVPAPAHVEEAKPVPIPAPLVEDVPIPAPLVEKISVPAPLVEDAPIPAPLVEEISVPAPLVEDVPVPAPLVEAIHFPLIQDAEPCVKSSIALTVPSLPTYHDIPDDRGLNDLDVDDTDTVEERIARMERWRQMSLIRNGRQQPEAARVSFRTSLSRSPKRGPISSPFLAGLPDDREDLMDVDETDTMEQFAQRVERWKQLRKERDMQARAAKEQSAPTIVVHEPEEPARPTRHPQASNRALLYAPPMHKGRLHPEFEVVFFPNDDLSMFARMYLNKRAKKVQKARQVEKLATRGCVVPGV
ncbi:hypothetical protein EW146_g8021 [Bondarzewia mesenterica]|uniref:Uncharacterized protein n=1 Tax=Bondarzewia mesenterica TaxID=1095465 RepID=A0A4S4LI96_9AGAM|nr:hypothetical protein EW146_g8021 [Bondarzewia mesenterica]